MQRRLTKISATTSLLLALTTGAWLVLWPCAYRGVEARPLSGDSAAERPVCATLIEVNGVDVLAVLAAPVLLSGVGLVAALAGWRLVLWFVTVVMVAFCLLSLPTIGAFYVPAAAALVVVALARGQARMESRT